MAEIVAGFGVPHTPMFPALVAREGPHCETAQLFRSVADHLEAVRPDALVIFDSDHLNTFFLNNFPTMSVGLTSQTSGPNDGTPGLPRYSVPVNEALASHVYASGLECGFDFAVSQEFEIDHSILVPLHFLTPTMQIPIVPIFINGVVHPLPAAKRCYALGQMLRQAVEALPGNARVAVLGSGSFSLDVGGPLSPRGTYSGVPDSGWAESVLGYLRESKTDDLLNAATSQRLARAGNVAGELLNWIAMLGVIGTRRPRFLEPQMEHGHAYGVWRWD
ncbi:MAG: extradiol ring-cleavage dioxygenase [Chloroflexi bacterium]|nr:extradiol ring-cleavage dioxygenase [Chloroflexota bacterium]MBV9598587.1 extradiol ring-cleavage dioxygenase [Chloroflexota bacterium]